MKPGTPNSLFVEVPWQREGIVYPGLAAVERSIEATDLDRVGEHVTRSVDGRQIVGLVQRRSRVQGAQSCEDFVVEPDRLGEVDTPVRDAVADANEWTLLQHA